MSEDINAFIKEINKRTEEEIRNIIENAENEAREIIHKAEEEAKKIFQHEALSRIILLKRKILGKAEMDGRHEIIRAKEEVMKKILRLTREKLELIVSGKDPSINYHEVLYNLLEEAIENIGEQEVIVEANERDKEYLSANLRRIEEKLSRSLGIPVKITLSEESPNILGGVIVYSKDKSKIYYNTLEGRLNETIKKYRTILGRILFADFLEK